MHVLVDLSFIKPGINGGTQTYVDNLLPVMRHADGCRVTCLTTSTNHGHYENLGLNCHKIEISSHNRVSRFVSHQKDVNRVLRTLRCDVLFCPGNLVPLNCRLPSVVTIHDMNYRDVAAYQPRARKWSYSLLLPLSAKRSGKIITPSRFSKERIGKHLRVPSGKVEVIHHGISLSDGNLNADAWRRIKQALGIKDRFICTINSGTPHKNTEGLVRAYARLRQRGKPIPQLVVAGHHFNDRLNQYIRERNMQEHIKSTGWLDEAGRNGMLSNSCAYVHPSLYEGFGFPVLEAQVSGVPVACSSTGSLPEVCGHSALYFDPRSEGSMIESLSSIVSDRPLRRSLIERGHRNVKRFSWTAAAEETMRVLHEVYRNRTGKALHGRVPGVGLS